MRKIAGLAAMEVEVGHPFTGVLDSLEWLAVDDASTILSLLVQSGHATTKALQKLLRDSYWGLDMSDAVPLRFSNETQPGSELLGPPHVDVVKIMRPCLGSLRELALPNVSSEFLSDQEIRELLVSCGRLEVLNLRGLVRLSDDTVSACLSCNPSLSRLDLAFCSGLSDDAFVRLAEPASPKLSELNVNCIDGLTSDALGYLDAGPCRESLEYLSIKGCTGITNIPQGSTPLFPNLQRLNAKGLSNLSLEDWHRLVDSPTSATRLRVLKLGECVLGASLAMALLPSAAKEAAMSSYRPAPSGSAQLNGEEARENNLAASAAIEAILGYGSSDTFGSMEHLDLSWCDGLSGKWAVALACASGPVLQTLKLRCLSLENDDDEGDDLVYPSSSVSMHPLVLIGQVCDVLTKLSVSRCGDRVACTEALQGLAFGRCSATLKDLDLSWTGACDLGVTSILDNCSALQMLTLQGCKLVTAGIGKHIPKISIGQQHNSFHLFFFFLFSFFFFFFFFLLLIVAPLSSARELRWVDLSWVNAMETSVVEDLVRANPKLCIVDYYGEHVKGGESHMHFQVLKKQGP